MELKKLLRTELTFNEEELQALGKVCEVLNSLLDEMDDTGLDEVVVHNDCVGETYYVKQTFDKVYEVLDTLKYAEDVYMEDKYDEER